jgi:hypothetical protein
MPIPIVMCESWPQACMTPLPLAYGRPVSSFTGRPSMSTRASTVGPGPFRRIARTPVPPTPSVTSQPAERASRAKRAAVFSSLKESSALAWNHL